MKISISTEELRILMEEHLEKAKIILSKDGYLDPVGFIFIGDQIGICPLRFKNQKEKERQLNGFKTFAKIKNADAAFLIIESWYVTSDKKDESIIPSKHPERKECIFAVGECKEGTITITQKFGRKKGKIIFEGKSEMTGLKSTIFSFGIKKDYDMAYG